MNDKPDDIDILQQDLWARLNGETARLEWVELARHFARGVVIRVDPALDLVRVAAAVVSDDREAVEQWTQSGEMAHASEDDARRWNDEHAVFWAVVTAPWVLVQEIRD